MHMLCQLKTGSFLDVGHVWRGNVTFCGSVQVTKFGRVTVLVGLLQEACRGRGGSGPLPFHMFHKFQSEKSTQAYQAFHSFHSFHTAPQEAVIFHMVG